MQLLSDRARPTMALALLAALALLCAWWVRATADGRIGNFRVLDEPLGTDVVLSLQRVLSVDGPDRYVVGNAAVRIPVQGPTAGLVVGEEVTVGGVVGSGAVVAAWTREAPARPAKRALGLAGLALGCGVFALGVRGRPGRWWVPGG